MLIMRIAYHQIRADILNQCVTRRVFISFNRDFKTASKR